MVFRIGTDDKPTYPRREAHECRRGSERISYDIAGPERQEEISQMIRSGNLTDGLRPKCPSPGVYHDIPFDEYLAWDAVSQSRLKPMLISPAHYRHAMDNPPDPNKDCFRFGRLCHSGKLEPLDALRRYVVMPDLTEGLTDDKGKPYKNPKATNAYKAKVEEFHRVNGAKEIVTQEWFDKVCGLIESLNIHPLASRWLGNDGSAEVSMVWQDPLTGILCRGRLDKLAAELGLFVDLKTTGRDISNFAKDIANFGYDLQAAFDQDGWELLTGERLTPCIVAVESGEPFSVRAAPLDEEAIAAGRSKYRKALSQLFECEKRGRWPGPVDPPAWSIPSYAMPSVTLTQHGQPLVTL